MAGIEEPYLPIVFIRGFAARKADIEAAADQVYTGFNDGSTKVRQNAEGDFVQSFFESVVVRLMKDDDLRYVDGYRDGKLAPWEGRRAPSRSFWVFRYYDLASKSFGDSERKTIEYYAAKLREFIIGTVRQSVCGDDAAAKANFKIHLVAHSFGGLIARCYLQNLCAHGLPKDLSKDLSSAALELDGPPVDSFVARFFTYGTPHNGIDIGPFNVPDLGPLTPFASQVFNRHNMAKYLMLDRAGRKWNADDGVHSLDGAITPDRVFNFIGSSWKDYDLISKAVIKEGSDGLVMMKNAYTSGPATSTPDRQGDPTIVRAYSPRAYAHRAHGGPLGMVNSEAGYQNLRRFLFGTHAFDMILKLNAVAHAKEMRPKIAAAQKRGQVVKYWYYVDVDASLRNVDAVLYERRAEYGSAIRLGPFTAGQDEMQGGKEVVLISGFMDDTLLKGRAKTENVMVGHMNVTVLSPVYEADGTEIPTGVPPRSWVLSERLTFNIVADDVKPAIQVLYRDPSGSVAAQSSASPVEQDGGLMIWTAPVGLPQRNNVQPKDSISGTLVIRAWPRRFP